MRVKQKKRRWSDEEKRSICFQTTASGILVAQVARRYAPDAAAASEDDSLYFCLSRLKHWSPRFRRYQFHTKMAEHYFCKICCIYPFHRKRVTLEYFGINVNYLENFDPTGIPIRATDSVGMK